MLGALLARAEAQVLRLSLVYALADGETTIDLPHLYAALDVWRYAEESALAIFGDAVGNPLADLILRELRDRRDKGMTRTEIREAIGHHEPATKIEAALDLLESRSLARCKRVPTGGRSTERWYAIFPPEGREQMGGNETSLSYLPLLRSEVGQQEAARVAESAAPRGDEENLPSPGSRGSGNNRYLVPEEESRGDLHESPAPASLRAAGTSEAELRRWAGGGEAP
jgi:hypothetical protein